MPHQLDEGLDLTKQRPRYEHLPAAAGARLGAKVVGGGGRTWGRAAVAAFPAYLQPALGAPRAAARRFEYQTYGDENKLELESGRDPAGNGRARSVGARCGLRPATLKLPAECPASTLPLH